MRYYLPHIFIVVLASLLMALAKCHGDIVPLLSVTKQVDYQQNPPVVYLVATWEVSVGPDHVYYVESKATWWFNDTWLLVAKGRPLSDSRGAKIYWPIGLMLSPTDFAPFHGDSALLRVRVVWEPWVQNLEIEP